MGMTSQQGLVPASTHRGVSCLLLWGSCPLWEWGRPLPALGRAWGPRAPATLRPAHAPRICSEDIECSGLTIPKAVQYLRSQDEKCQAIGAYYIQHTCFQDESAKQQVSSRGPGGSLSLPQAGGGHLLLAPRPPARLPKAVSVPGTAQSRGNVCGGDATQPLVVEETLE